MEIEHDPRADVMYIRLSAKPFHKNQVLANGLVVIDLAEDGMVIGIELISPSSYVDNPHEMTYRVASASATPADG